MSEQKEERGWASERKREREREREEGWVTALCHFSSVHFTPSLRFFFL